MSAQSIEFEIYPESPGELARGDQEETLAALLQEPDANARIEDRHKGEAGILPVVPLIIIAGVLGAISLGKFIEDWVCRKKKRGMIIDARGDTLKINKDVDLPGGEILIFAKDGTSKEVNVCDEKTEISALVSALSGGASADDAAKQAETDGKDGGADGSTG